MEGIIVLKASRFHTNLHSSGLYIDYTGQQFVLLPNDFYFILSTLSLLFISSSSFSDMSEKKILFYYTKFI